MTFPKSILNSKNLKTISSPPFKGLNQSVLTLTNPRLYLRRERIEKYENVGFKGVKDASYRG
jgi:hypothetical protein